MAESQRNAGGGRGSTWTLRLAGSQEDMTPNLWAEDARASGFARLRGGLSRCQGLMLTVLAGVLAAAAAYVFWTPPQYEASFRLAVQTESPGDAGRPPMPLTVGELEREAKEIGSREAIRRTASLAGAATVDEIEDGLRVEPLPESSVIEITFRHGNPGRAAATVQGLAGLYAENHDQARSAARSRTSFEKQQAVYENEAEQARRALASFRQRNRASQLERQKQEEQARSMALAAERKTLEARIADWQERLSALTGTASLRERANIENELKRLIDRERGVREEMNVSQSRHSTLERLVAERARLEQTALAAEQKAEDHQARAPRPSAREDAVLLTVAAAESGEAAVESTRLEPWTVLLIGLVAATLAALGVLAAVDPYRRTAGYVADITEATEAPLLRMIEETHSHVS